MSACADMSLRHLIRLRLEAATEILLERIKEIIKISDENLEKNLK